MPPSLILSVITFLLAIGFFLLWRRAVRSLKSNPDYSPSKTQDVQDFALVTKVVFWVLLILTPLLVLNASANMVPSQHSGIVTQFKAATGQETGKGLVFVAPWQKVSSWDNSRQTWDHLNEKNCVAVRIVGSQTACLEIKIEWVALKDRAAEQWAAYKAHDFEVFVDRRINPSLTQAVNDAYEKHDPLSNVDAKTGAINPPPKAPFEAGIRTAILDRIGSDIDTTKDGLRINIGFIHYPKEVQDQIKQYQEKVLENRVLQQEETNADTRKRITEKNAQRDLRAWCLEIAEKHEGSQPGLCLGVGATPVLPLK